MTVASDEVTWIVLGHDADDVVAVILDPRGTELSRAHVADVVSWVAEREASHRPRWVWSDTSTWYRPLLAAGVRVARAHDLRLCHAILRDSHHAEGASELRAATEWDAVTADLDDPVGAAPALFEFDAPALPQGAPDGIAAALAEFARQRTVLAASPRRLALLTAAESAGGLLAAELRAAGLPWDRATHERILDDTLGPRPAGGGDPPRLREVADRVRAALSDPALRLDSQPKLLRALHRAGILVESTSKWELAEHEHPAIAPLLEYKRLARLMSANGWTWLDEWVAEGRFRPVYIPGGVVTGRWASSGGGALQLPRRLRTAVRADPGWMLVVADVAQLEPRVLAAMSRDTALADAARGVDLYAGIVDSGVVATRAEAKIALLGAMYGATTGDSGRLVPRLRRTYPRAMRLVDDAARRGEDGGVVSTWLGRSSAGASAAWRSVQARASAADSSDADEIRARRWARDRGRFTRNFVVQGTAAEWALAWLADLRGRLAEFAPVAEHDAASASGPWFGRRPHLAFFLHDEVVVHTPAEYADDVAIACREAAAAAGRLLFGDFPVDFPLDARVSETAAKG